MQEIIITDKDKRELVAGALATAGYTVRIVPKKIGKITRLVIQYWRENDVES